MRHGNFEARGVQQDDLLLWSVLLLALSKAGEAVRSLLRAERKLPASKVQKLSVAQNAILGGGDVTKKYKQATVYVSRSLYWRAGGWLRALSQRAMCAV